MQGEFVNENLAGELQDRRPFWRFMLQSIIILQCIVKKDSVKCLMGNKCLGIGFSSGFFKYDK